MLRSLKQTFYQFEKLVSHNTLAFCSASVTKKKVLTFALVPLAPARSLLKVSINSLSRNTRGEVSMYYWPPVWLVWNRLYDNWQFLFLFTKQTKPNHSNRRWTVQWYFPPLVLLGLSQYTDARRTGTHFQPSLTFASTDVSGALRCGITSSKRF